MNAIFPKVSVRDGRVYVKLYQEEYSTIMGVLRSPQCGVARFDALEKALLHECALDPMHRFVVCTLSPDALGELLSAFELDSRRCDHHAWYELVARVENKA